MSGMRLPALIVCALAVALGGCWPPSGLAQGDQPDAQVQPGGPPPAEPPPPPAAGDPSTAPPPSDDAQPSPTPAAQGQWVFTRQYGWIWAPYDQAYTWVPPGGAGEPEVYAYYPSYGWRWLVAPWIWGIGPWPYFGARGPRPFFWYRSGWWRTPSRWRFVPAPEVRSFEGHERGFRPAPWLRPGETRPDGRVRPAPGRPEGRGSGGDDRGRERGGRDGRGR